ncbi:MAG TPA: DUF3261 domain-containing protein [Nevskiaceae bacterium]|nr:DUF3261 domain-containing protein [Nevskiaceae bacterium]
MRHALAAIAILLSACAHEQTVQSAPEIFPVLPPSTLGTERSVQQVLNVSYRDQEATLSVVLDVTQAHLQVVGLNAVGVRLFTIDYDGERLKTEKLPGLPDAIDARRMLADLQLALWPLTALQAATQNSTYAIGEPTAGTRRVKRSGKLYEEVHYAGTDPWSGKLWLSNYEFGYSIAVESAPLGAR